MALAALASTTWASRAVTSLGSVSFTNGVPQFYPGVIDTQAAAFGSYDPAVNHVSYFAVLKIETNPAFSDQEQMLAAGFLEGALTSADIWNMYNNAYSTYSWAKTGPPACLTNWLDQQEAYVRQQILTPTGNLQFWEQVGLIMNQYDGLVAGYNLTAAAGQQLNNFAFQMLNGQGDFFDIIPAACPSMQPNFDNMTKAEFEMYLHTSGHCSAIVKMLDDFSDIYMSHDAWYEYQAMTRIFKHYNFQTTLATSKKISFSSYPGFLESLDDFYVLESNMVMLETTNNIFDRALYQFVHPESVLAWQRVRTANALANTGSEWGALMTYNNSGTYNNQYMIIDLKLFTPGQQLVNGTLTIVEQIPGLVVYTDQTDTLERGYWPSYNVAFHPEIYDKSGYPAIVEKFGVTSSYQLAPRAQIFRRDSGNINDVASLQYFMRYNDYLNDPIAHGDPWNAICSRGDLTSVNYTSSSPNGCYDTKMTTSGLAAQMQAMAINGPTNQGLPSFKWSEFPTATHMGQPEEFDFQFELQDPDWSNPFPVPMV